MTARKAIPDAASSLGGYFIPSPPTDKQLADAMAEARRMGFVHLLLMGERADGTCGMVTINMASINHLIEVVDRGMNQFPQWSAR